MAAVPLCKLLFPAVSGRTVSHYRKMLLGAHSAVSLLRSLSAGDERSLLRNYKLTIPNLSKLILSYGVGLVKLRKITVNQNRTQVLMNFAIGGHDVTGDQGITALSPVGNQAAGFV